MSRKHDLFAGVAVPETRGAGPGELRKPCAVCDGRRGRRLFQQAHFPVVRCDGCGLVYADEGFTAEDLRAFYTGDTYERAYVCSPPRVEESLAAGYVRAFHRIVRRRPGGGRLLDFGASRGTFLARLGGTPEGRSWERSGIDVNPDEVARARAIGLDVRCLDLFSGGLGEARFDAITAFSVLEHMQDPLRTLCALREHLAPEGLLLLIVPSGRSLVVTSALLADRWLGRRTRVFTDHVFHEEHLYYFTHRTLAALLRRAGLAPLEFGGAPSYLETRPPGLALRIGAPLLRGASFLLRRQTMLVALARREG